ncbi:MAG: MFS transporter [Actinomycetota bacterium]|nr:MFS transporter [Actinomycetota bacterium]
MQPSTAAKVLEPQRRRMILVATCTALMAVVASASGLNVAQQQVAEDLDASQMTVLWIINSYIVVLAALLLPVGAIADRWGRKPVLMAGLVVFGLASAAAAFAESSTFLIITRVVAGVGAAMIMPVTLSVITSSFPAEARAQAIGIWAGVAGGGGLLGMIIAALLTDLASWRWLFALPVLLVAAAFLAGRRSIPNSTERVESAFDMIGSVLSIVAVGSLVLAIDRGPEDGWTTLLTLTALLAGVAASAGFAAWELRCQAPLLDLRTFRDARLKAGSVTQLFTFGVLAGVFIVLFPYFQAVLGWSALRSILGLLPMVTPMMAASALAPIPAKRFGARATMLTGIGLAATGLALMAAMVSVDGGYASVLPGMLVIGLGMGLTMTPSTEAITSALPDERQGVASAINDTTREVGSALGVALLGAVLAAEYREAIKPLLSSLPERTTDAAGEGIARAFTLAAQTRGDEADTLITAARQAFVDGWASSMWIGAAAMGGLFVLVFIIGPLRPTSSPPPSMVDAEAGGDDRQLEPAGTGASHSA